jgi:hypothetical protein
MSFLDHEAPKFFKNFGTPCRSYESLLKLGALMVIKKVLGLPVEVMSHC